MKNRLFLTAALSLAVSTTLTSCDEETLSAILELFEDTDDGTRVVIDDKGLGWLENDEDPETIEDDIGFRER